MRKTTKNPGEKIVKDNKRATPKQYSSKEKIRIVLDGLRGEDSIAERSVNSPHCLESQVEVLMGIAAALGPSEPTFAASAQLED